MTTALAPALRLEKAKPTQAREGLAVLLLMRRGVLRKRACERVGVALRTFERWTEQDAEFTAQYQDARIAQAHAMAEDLIELADSPVGADMAEVQRNRLRVDTRKWFITKLAPRIYGDRVEHTHKHTVGVVMLPPIAGAQVHAQVAGNAVTGAGTGTVKALPATVPEDAGQDEETGTELRAEMFSGDGTRAFVGSVSAIEGAPDSQSPAMDDVSHCVVNAWGEVET